MNEHPVGSEPLLTTTSRFIDIGKQPFGRQEACLSIARRCATLCTSLDLLTARTLYRETPEKNDASTERRSRLSVAADICRQRRRERGAVPREVCADNDSTRSCRTIRVETIRLDDIGERTALGAPEIKSSCSSRASAKRDTVEKTMMLDTSSELVPPSTREIQPKAAPVNFKYVPIVHSAVGMRSNTTGPNTLPIDSGRRVRVPQSRCFERKLLGFRVTTPKERKPSSAHITKSHPPFTP